jgi:hypothetical protein
MVLASDPMRALSFGLVPLIQGTEFLLSGGLALTMLAGCETTKPVSLPSGQQGVAVHCSGAARSWSDCMNAAGTACGVAYDIVSEDGESVGGMATPVGNSAMFVHAIHREMIVSCHGRS